MAHVDWDQKRFVFEDEDFYNIIQVLWLLNKVKDMKFGQLVVTFRLHEGVIQDATTQEFQRKKFDQKDISTLAAGLTEDSKAG